MKYSRGFSFIEMLVVMSIIALMAVVLILNFRSPNSSATGRHQVSSALIADLRRMQSLSLAGSAYDPISGPPMPVCGYGVHYLDSTHYIIFARVFVSAPCQSLKTRLYTPADDIIMETKTIANPLMEFAFSFDDIYYAIPYASVFIGGLSLTPDSVPSTQISIFTAERPLDITTITILASGTIDLAN